MNAQMILFGKARKDEAKTLRKTDISQYSGTPMPSGNHPSSAGTAKKTVGIVFGTIFKVIGTILMIGVVTGIIVGISVLINIFKMADDTVDLDLHTLKLDLTSFIYVNDEEGNPVEYQPVYAGESRVWVEYDQIPEAMKDAIIAIEDKRFYDHKGVDWIRTGGAVLNMVTGGNDSGAGGGSTITQQLIKNLTNRNEVSLTRKVTEIFSALEFEKKYSKDEILETYLNVVNFGGGSNGVQAAANLYFNKDIKDCSIAECAALAAIPNNPYWFMPILYPDNNKERQQNILEQMLDQEKISKAEYDQAMAESENMVFIGRSEENVVDNVHINNWYTEAMLKTVATDLASALNVDYDVAEYKVMHGGLKIYSAMDQRAQQIAEEVMNDPALMPEDQDMQFGYVMMDYNGRVLASVGQRGKKEANLLWDYTTSEDRLPASSFKPLGAYAPAIDAGLFHYSSMMTDAPLKNIPGTEGDWPVNWYAGYKGQIPLAYALEISSNAVAAQTVKAYGLENSFNFVTQKLHITSLDSEDMVYSAMATGEGRHGVTVREMAAGFQIFGNGGVYNEPYLYFYVEDNNGNVILDNRENQGEQVIKSSTATIIRRLLENVVNGAEGTGGMAKVPNWMTYAKTGTTLENEYSWLCGGTYHAAAALWCGYETPSKVSPYNSNFSKTVWRNIMQRYLENQDPSVDFTDDPDVVPRAYCKQTGKLAGDKCGDTAIGYYDKNSLPAVCDGNHPNANGSSSEPSSSSQAPSAVSSEISSASVPEPSTSVSVPSSEPPSSAEPSSSEPPSQPPSSEGPSSSEVSSGGTSHDSSTQ